MNVETVTLWEDGSSARYISYLFEKEESLKMVDKRPAILICPGGGYLSTEYREGEPVAMHFLNLGYQVFVLHYHPGQREATRCTPNSFLILQK